LLFKFCNEKELVMEKAKESKPKMSQTTGSSVETKENPDKTKVHREGNQTYEAYADDYWDQAP
jgi:hypothetical protein